MFWRGGEEKRVRGDEEKTQEEVRRRRGEERRSISRVVVGAPWGG